MITPEMKKMIESNALALATVSPKGEPHCIALGYVQVINDHQLLATSNYIRESVKNIARVPQVALAAWNREWEKECEGYELIGRAEYFTDGPWLEKIQAIPENRGEPCLGAIVITVEKVKKLA